MRGKLRLLWCVSVCAYDPHANRSGYGMGCAEVGGPQAVSIAEVPSISTFPRVVTISNYPNPFNPVTTPAFYVPDEGRVRLDVFDLRGRLVRQLVDRHMSEGDHEVQWDGADGQGAMVGSGVYFARVE